MIMLREIVKPFLFINSIYSPTIKGMIMLRLLIILQTLLHVLNPVEAVFSLPPYQIAKANCNNTCANVTIPFPFGIGTGCFLDEWYEIVCINNTIPTLKKLDLEVMNISLPQNLYRDENTIAVRYPIVYSNTTCSESHNIRAPIDFTGSPFAFSVEGNIFVAVGCDNTAIMGGSKDPSFVGCRTECTGNNTRQYSTCTGYDCCYSAIPQGLQAYNVDFQSEISGHECQFAFLVNSSWFQPNVTDLHALRDASNVPVVLEWGISNVSHLTSLGLQIDNNQISYRDFPYECVATSNINQNTTLIQCSCDSGFQGNPFLLDGCEDINECEQAKGQRCPHTCRNVPGYYECVRNRTPMFLAIGFSSGFGSLLLIFLSWWTYRLIKQRREAKLKQKFFKRNGGLILQQQHLSSPGSSVEKGKLFSAKELEKATDNFNIDRVLGQGGQGTVYKGMLTDGRIVAIKKSTVIDEDNVEQFINEVVILSTINHRNIVRILGCCLESEVPLLVYEFIPNGTLYRYIHDPNEEFPLSWKIRLRIATEIASALSYLHSSASIPIYHRDIKTTNILLDKQYRAKIADFGTSRTVTLDQTHVTTLVQGTFGYLDPEYFQSSQFTDKSDVYSFGVVLVELLTGQKPVSSTRASEGRSLAMYFIISMEENRLFDIVDAQFMKQGGEEEITAVARLAKRCLNLKGRKRPTMKEVVMELERIRNHGTQNLPQAQEETDDHVEAETFEEHDAFLKSRMSEIDVDTITFSDIQPFMLTDTL